MSRLMRFATASCVMGLACWSARRGPSSTAGTADTVVMATTVIMVIMAIIVATGTTITAIGGAITSVMASMSATPAALTKPRCRKPTTAAACRRLIPLTELTATAARSDSDSAATIAVGITTADMATTVIVAATAAGIAGASRCGIARIRSLSLGSLDGIRLPPSRRAILDVRKFPTHDGPAVSL